MNVAELSPHGTALDPATRRILEARTRRLPDFEAENRALLSLADSIAEDPSTVLVKLCETVMALCRAGSAGVSLFEGDEGIGRFVWAAVAGRWAPYAGGGMPRDQSPCGVVIDSNACFLMEDPQASYPAAAGIQPKIFEILLAPVHAHGKAVGTVWLLSHDDERRFDAEDCRRLVSMARFASAARQSQSAEIQLKDAQRQLKLTLTNSQIIGLWDWRFPENLVYADRRFAELYGVDPDVAARGAPVSAFLGGIHPDDLSGVQADIDIALKTGEPFSSEYRVLSPQGIRHVMARGRCELGPDRAPVVFRGAVIDISEQRIAEFARDESQSRYQSLFKTIDAGFCVIEMIFDAAGQPIDYRFIETNPAFERQTGLRNALGRTIRELVPGIEQHWPDTYGAVALTGKPIRFENVAKNLGDRWYEVQAFCPGDKPGRQVALLFTDVTERRRIQDELRSSEDSLRALARAMPNHVWTATPTGQLNWFNDQVYEYSGALQGELDGDGWAAMVHPDDISAAAGHWGAATKGGNAYETEFRLRRHDGTFRWHIARAVPLFDKSGGIERWVGTNTDIEDQKAAASVLADVNAELEARVVERTASLVAAEESLRQSQKMEAVGQLTGGVAHDFNNLLTIIRTSIDLLRRPTLSEERRHRMMEAISNAVTRAAKLTSQLLAFARRQVLQPKVFDAAQNVVSVAEMLGPLCGSRVRIETTVPDSPCFVHADASQFDTAVVNMAVNARDAMQGRGTLVIAVDEANCIPAIRNHPAMIGEFIVVSVSDTGSGIPPDHMQRIFEPFFTTKEVGLGTGLGLSQVIGFAKQSGGEVQVVSTEGKGSTFRLYLARATQLTSENAQDAELPAVGSRGGCILLVEDNPDVAASVEQSLQVLGYSVVAASSADEALQCLAEGPTRFAAVFSDVVMSGMSGIDLGHKIHREHPGLPVVLSSGYSHVLAQNPSHGFALLPKPYSVDDLAKVMADATATGRDATAKT